MCNMTFLNNATFLKRILTVNIRCIRYKHKENHWSVIKKKKTSADKALEHFDNFYKEVYRGKWPAIRKALLGKQKYIAVVNNYSDNEEICSYLEGRGAINIRKIFEANNEYLKEKFVKDERESRLKTIQQLANDVDGKEIEKEENSIEKSKFSLERSLEDAEYDTTRLIDANSGLSVGTLHEFIPATKIKGREDFVEESEYFDFAKSVGELKVEKVKEFNLHFPEHLNVYCYEESNWTEFPKPRNGTTGVLNYYLMDGGSLLSVLALDLRPGLNLLDMCAAPGGKSLLALQTLYVDRIFCNDSTISRTKRIHNVMRQYLYDFDENWLNTSKIDIHCQDARLLKEQTYDRVLVDVPCTTDRHSVNEDENNIFRADRIKERLKLPELQSELLFKGLKMVKKGGIVVYSTCTLSPIQNDGVVHMALKRIWEETKLEFIVKDMIPALQQVKSVYNLARPSLTKYGSLVVPISAQNYGPTYFCKLERVN